MFGNRLIGASVSRYSCIYSRSPMPEQLRFAGDRTPSACRRGLLSFGHIPAFGPEHTGPPSMRRWAPAADVSACPSWCWPSPPAPRSRSPWPSREPRTGSGSARPRRRRRASAPRVGPAGGTTSPAPQHAQPRRRRPAGAASPGRPAAPVLRLARQPRSGTAPPASRALRQPAAHDDNTRPRRCCTATTTMTAPTSPGRTCPDRCAHAGCMLAHPTHDHWHFDAMAGYSLRSPTTDQRLATRAR